VSLDITGVKADRDLQLLFGILVLTFFSEQNTQIAADDRVMR